MTPDEIHVVSTSDMKTYLADADGADEAMDMVAEWFKDVSKDVRFYHEGTLDEYLDDLERDGDGIVLLSE